MFLLLREGEEFNEWLPKPRDCGEEQKKGQAIAGHQVEWERPAQRVKKSRTFTTLVMEQLRQIQFVC